VGVRTEKVEVLLCAASRGSEHQMCWNCRNHYVRVTILESRTQKRKFLWQGIGMRKFYVQLVPFSIVLSLAVANYRVLITFVNTTLLATHYVCMSVIMYVCTVGLYMFVRSVRTCVCTVCMRLYSRVSVCICVVIFVCK
jgi:hypothetical protein